MRWMLSPLLLALFVCPAWAKRLTVAQLERAILADSAAHKTDLEIARRINASELSERLTQATLERLGKPFPDGSQTTIALLLLADRSAFLDPPADELPATPPPDPARQVQMLAAAQKFALETLPSLPNLLATRTTLSFDDSPQAVTRGGYQEHLGMHLLGSAKAEVSVRNERENRAQGNGSALGQPKGGLMTWGEFGSTLLIILSDSAHGKTAWSHWEQTQAGEMAVFHYEVPKTASHYEIDTPVAHLELNGGSNGWANAGGRSSMTVSSNTRMLHSKPGYEGSLWIDPASGTIRRVTLVADLKGNPTFERGAILVDYGPVTIADKTLICPVRSLALSASPQNVNATFEGYATQWLNENVFSGYHLFASTARILDDKAGAAPPASSTATAAAAASPLAAQLAAQPPAAPVTAEAEPAPAAAAPPPGEPPGGAAQAGNAEPTPPQPAHELSSTASSSPPPPPPPASEAPPPPAAASAAVPPPAAVPAPGTNKDFVLRVNVDSLLVPVVVRDRAEHAVGGLSQANFTVLDQGKPRPITGFSVVRSAHFEPIGKSGDGRKEESVTAPPPPGPNRIIVFLFDDRHLDSSDLPRVQKAAIRVLDQSLAPSDYAAVISLMGVNSGITQDRAVLDQAVMKLSVHQALQHDTHECPDIDYYAADRIINHHDVLQFQIATAKVDACFNMPRCEHSIDIENANCLDQRMALQAAHRAMTMGEEDSRQSLLGVEAVVRAMAKLPGTRLLTLISPGFLSLAADAMTFKSTLIDQALAAGIVINSLDARGLYTGNVDASEGGPTTISQMVGQTSQNRLESMEENENAMAELANDTGGTFFGHNNDLEGGLKSLMAEPEYHYLLEISLKDVKPTGTFHRLQVKVDQAGLRVQSRGGYFAPKESRKP